MSDPFLDAPLPWPWPLDRVHKGMPLGNGTFGALLWGDGEPLKITINRQDYWDHHGGIEWTEEANFENLKRLLAEGNEAELRRIFEGRDPETGERPVRPTRLPMGRVDLRFRRGRVDAGELNLRNGEAALRIDGLSCAAFVSREEPLLCLRIEGKGADAVEIAGVPPDAPDVLEHLRSLGYPEAKQFKNGWIQERPDEPALVVAWKKARRSRKGVEVFVCAVYGSREDAEKLLDKAAKAGYAAQRRAAAAWWKAYWKQACRIELPNRTLMLLYYLGLYKLAGLSVPGGPAATLQGPWVEEHRLPPWSSDYHFNINVQECYWPAYGANHLECLKPLFEMIESWKPKLRRNARCFLGVDDGYILPHAVDDRGTCMGGFWTGSVDHGSTAWTAQLMWQYYRYTMDADFLRETAYPFMKGAMRAYEAMLEEDDDGKLKLPIGVSPEFGGANMDAWGKNASFQLAIIHFLCRQLTAASEILGVDEADRAKWRDIDERLPIACVSEDGSQILLWEGQPLSESHRHHSHLAGLYPFDVFDIHGDEADRKLVLNSMDHLTRMGMSAWSGWCVPWAAILYARIGYAGMAELLLEIFRRAFMNEGYGSQHDAEFRGLTRICSRPDIMQIEAAMGAAAAVLEMLVQCSQGVVRVCPAIPDWWRDVAFKRLRAEGAFLISGKIRGKRIKWIKIEAEAGGTLRLANPFGEDEVVLKVGREISRLRGPLFEIELRAGEEVKIAPARRGA